MEVPWILCTDASHVQPQISDCNSCMQELREHTASSRKVATDLNGSMRIAFAFPSLPEDKGLWWNALGDPCQCDNGSLDNTSSTSIGAVHGQVCPESMGVAEDLTARAMFRVAPLQDASDPAQRSCGEQTGAAERCTSSKGRPAGEDHDSKTISEGSADAATARRRRLRRAGRRLLCCGEVAAIVRPLVYVSLLRRWGRRSWTPWVASLLCDLLSRLLTLRGHVLLSEVRRLLYVTQSACCVYHLH
jgi:hypothetical protein